MKDIQRQNEKLKQEVETVYKSAVFWEKEYNREKSETNKYKNLFYVCLFLFILISVIVYAKL